MTLKTYLNTPNNLTIFRIFLAMLVIFGHSFFLTKLGIDNQEPFKRIFEHVYAGSIAVKIFFILSGMMLTNSLIKKLSSDHYSLDNHKEKAFNICIKDFLIKRCSRIFPGLIALLFFTTFIVGPLFTESTLLSYFKDSGIYYYFKYNILLDTVYTLPDVFSHNVFTTVNGSLWTLRYEFICYLFLAFIFFIMMIQNKFKKINFLENIFLVIIISNIFFCYDNNWVNLESYLLPTFFSLGCLIALYSPRINLNKSLKIFIFLLSLLFIFLCLDFKDKLLVNILIPIAVFLLSFLILNSSILKNIILKSDPSYGIYLYGYLIQQILVSCLPSLSLFNHFVLALTLSTFVGYLSWFLVEKKFINFKF